MNIIYSKTNRDLKSSCKIMKKFFIRQRTQLFYVRNTFFLGIQESKLVGRAASKTIEHDIAVLFCFRSELQLVHGFNQR